MNPISGGCFLPQCSPSSLIPNLTTRWTDGNLLVAYYASARQVNASQIADLSLHLARNIEIYAVYNTCTVLLYML